MGALAVAVSDDRTPTALDAAFVLGATLIGTRLIARSLGLSPTIGTLITISAATATSTGLGGETVQRLAGAVLAPANRARLALEHIELSPRMLGGSPE
jgi:tetrahydromethanopterin S-methyltransferase subunit D